MWNSPGSQHAFKESKTIISNAPVIKYFDSEKELIVQCDPSNKALRACIPPKGKPIAYNQTIDIRTNYDFKKTTEHS